MGNSRDKLPKNLRNTVCRRCESMFLLTFIESEYDWEISCHNCGELWWVEKENEVKLKGDELKYKSSPYIKSKSKKHKKKLKEK